MCQPAILKCTCDGFYDPRLVADARPVGGKTYLHRVLPYLCRDALALKDVSVDPLDPVTGQRLAYTPLESLEALVDVEGTRARAVAFNRSVTCGTGAFTKDWFVAKVVAGDLRYGVWVWVCVFMLVYMAGLVRRHRGWGPAVW